MYIKHSWKCYIFTFIPRKMSKKSYRLLDRIGGGAFGVVWKVCNKETQEIFAMKKIHAGLEVNKP